MKGAVLKIDDNKKDELIVRLPMSTVMETFPSLQKLAKANTITGRTGYWLGRFYKAVKSEVDEFENQRMKLVKQYAATDSDGNFINTPNSPGMINITKENVPLFNAGLQELLDIEHSFILSIGRFKVDVDALINGKTSILSPEEQEMLEPLIEWQGV